MRAAIYCRISRDVVGRELGVQRQEDGCRKLCEVREWEVAGIYVDNDLSAYSGKPRPQFDAMINAIKTGGVQAIVAWHPDRLTRHTRELEGFIDLVQAHHVEIATVQGGAYDLSTASGKMQARIVGAVARHESELKSERLQAKFIQNARAGAPHGGSRPYGYEKDGMTIIPAEAEIIRELAVRVLSGEHLRALARDLNGRGVPTVTGKGRWSSQHLGRMLKQPRLAGLREHRGDVVGTAQWPAILDRPTHDALRRLLGDPDRVSYRPPRKYLLARLAFCGHCGHRLFSQGAKTARGKQWARGYGCRGCFGIFVAADPLEEYVIEVVRAALDHPDLHERLTRRRKPSGEADQLLALEQELEELSKDFGAGRISRKVWLDVRSTLEPRIEAARAADAEATRGVVINANMAKRWEALSFDQRQAVLAAVLDRVVVNKAAVPGRHAFDYDRVTFIWRA